MKQRIRNAFNSAVYRNYYTMVDDVVGARKYIYLLILLVRKFKYFCAENIL